MPRPKLIDRPVAKKLSLRSSLVTEIDGQLADRLTGKPEYGAWTELVEALLKKWLEGDIEIHLKPKVVDLGDLLNENVQDAVPQTEDTGADGKVD